MPAAAQAEDTAPRLPPAVQAALARAGVPLESVSVLVVDTAGGAPRLAWQSGQAMNPASVMKLVTAYAALDRLGAAYVWRTPVFFGGRVQGGVLRGPLYIRGGGDPKLVMERIWLLLRRVQGMGVRAIDGDIVLDNSRFALPAHDAARFDGNPLRPYNAAPDALLLNFKALTLHFTPDDSAGAAHVQYDPPLGGMALQERVPLAAKGSQCGDWKAQLKLDAAQAARRIAFGGQFPAACGAKIWHLAPAAPDAFAAHAIAGMWQALGGSLTGQVRSGRVPDGLKAALELPSPALAEVIRDINKYSNNVMAQQVFLTLSMTDENSPASFAASRQILAQWWRTHWPQARAPHVDNGAGLSRSARITADSLAHMLQHAWRSPLMPEFVASLPLAGVDGTLRRRFAQARMRAHLKTGTLADVSALAGYVHAASGRRYVLVAIANHANAQAAQAAWEALLDWTAHDMPADGKAHD